MRAGDALYVRGERWRLALASRYEHVTIIDADGCDAGNRGVRARFILPFEPVVCAADRLLPPRVVTGGRWRRAARALLADAVPHWGSLRAAARAQLTVLPFQLEPALAVTRGDACRLLIADEVGLGKTIQAGLIAAEAIARNADARVLVVAPAGLRDQWRGELHERFQIAAEVLDAEGVARSTAELAAGVNPWSVHPVAITSIDYVKRPEVMRSLETLVWDVVILDEAHGLAGRSDRAAAAAALSRRARVLVQLTATPHSGDDEAFSRLHSLGDLDAGFPLRIFRRTRADVGLPHGRRSTRLRVRPTAAEAAMHEGLEHYAVKLAGDSATLLATVFFRRGCSSAFSLARSMERRLALLTAGPLLASSQLLLPFAAGDSDEEPAGELAMPGLRDSVEEVALLERVAALARDASIDESKIAALRRLVRRTREPIIVFTEYRDTLLHLAERLSEDAPLQLHGGLTWSERSDVIRQFTSGPATLLLATDAASEGLNLHHRCRLVINLELPWTPLRLEQRIGRVDRLGQSRRVHAVQLVARGTREESIETRLDERQGRVAAALASPTRDPVVSTEARDEAIRLLTARMLARNHEAPWSGAPLVAVSDATDRSGRIYVFRLACVDDTGHVVFTALAGLTDEGEALEPGEVLRSSAALHHARLVATETAAVGRWLDLAQRREDAIMAALRDSHARLSAALLQPGLFDRRAERAAAAQAARVDEALQKSAARLAVMARGRSLHAGERTFVFGVLFRS